MKSWFGDPDSAAILALGGFLLAWHCGPALLAGAEKFARSDAVHQFIDEVTERLTPPAAAAPAVPPPFAQSPAAFDPFPNFAAAHELDACEGPVMIPVSADAYEVVDYGW